MPLEVGEGFAGYTVVRKLGAGGMGSVYLVQHPRLPRQDALKVLTPELSADPQYRARFLREAELVAGLSHANILAIHDRGEYDGQLWIAMDYVAGTDAASLLREHYPHGMPPPEALDILTAVASALDYAHQHGCLHRDVKPANILLAEPETKRRRIFLADFGIARRVDDTAGLTATNMAVGTVAYAAPEQLLGEAVDARADQYALACTAFQLLTGSHPYDYSSAAVVITKHVTAPPPSIGEKRPELTALDPVFAKAMAKKPDHRYPSCKQFTQELHRALTGQPTALEDTWTRPLTAEQTRPDRIYLQDTHLAADQPPPIHGQDTQAAQLAPKPGPRRWLRRPAILVPALLTIVVLAAGGVFAAVKLTQHSDTTPPPSAAPNTGPFTGTYTVDFGPEVDFADKPVEGSEPATETWELRSACQSGGCVATASRRSGDETIRSTLVFDEVGGHWVAVGTTSITTCKGASVETWGTITLELQPDGKLSGEYLEVSARGCGHKRTVTFIRTGDAHAAGLPDPAGQAPRVVSPAEALHGRYHYTSTYDDGEKEESNFVVRTDCLRSGERCMSFFHNPDGEFIALVFANRTWARDSQRDAPCPPAAPRTRETRRSFCFPNRRRIPSRC